MNFTSKIYLRSNVARKSGLLPIYLRIIIKRKKKEYFLNIEIPADLWDEKNTCVKRNKDYPYENMNAILLDVKSRLNKITQDTIFREYPITLNEFHRLFSRKTTNDGSFYTYAKQFIEENKHKFSKETIRTYGSQITKMKSFRNELKFFELDEDFLLQYERYLLNTLHNNTNTHYKSMGFIKTVYKRALADGLAKEGIFKNFPLTKKDGNRESLNFAELKTLENLLDSNMPKYLLNVLRYFLFSCHTGLRYTDIKNITLKNIIGGEMIQIIMHKTQEIVRIPLTPTAKKLIGEGFENQKIFKVATNQVANKYLKQIMKHAGIEKNISFHCARHTFATCSIDFGIPVEVISKLLGHKKIGTTMIYAKIMDNVKIREMGKWN